ncbi:L,D-transpeptidase scaffold domain-containing protein [Mucilaginibacter sp.]
MKILIHSTTVIKIMLLVLLLAPFKLKAASDTTIAHVLKKSRASLYYPLSVERFYKANGYKLAWIAADTNKTHVWDAMLLLDCVKQYGLNHDDYHPKQLLYPVLHKLISQNKKDEVAALYDVFLTDAIIRFINDLHYGKLNPVYTTEKVDQQSKFKAYAELMLALNNNDFGRTINSVQPKSKLYFDLQNHMRLLVGQRSGDCYVIPQGVIRKMAINMERLRWISTTGEKVHLTMVVKEGTIINYKDIHHQDIQLEKSLYNESRKYNKKFNLNKTIPSKL